MLSGTKATRQDILRFAKDHDVIEVMDLVNRFGYSLKGAKMKLYRLEKAHLIEKLGLRPWAYCLTNEGDRRLQFYEQQRREI